MSLRRGKKPKLRGFLLYPLEPRFLLIQQPGDFVCQLKQLFWVLLNCRLLAQFSPTLASVVGLSYDWLHSR
jgi:hypothetical protein